jgi:hypothetical protein
MPSEDKTPSDEKTDNRAQNQGSDGADASDGHFANSMENKAQKRYEDYFIDGKAIWDIERRGVKPEEVQAWKDEYERQGKQQSKSKLADMALANLAGNGLLDKNSDKML